MNAVHRLFHVHRAERRGAEGAYRFDECRCGARRVTVSRAAARRSTPGPQPGRPGWPLLGEMGESWTDTGWRQQTGAPDA